MKKADEVETPAVTGLRERSKQERRDRIIMAARELFSAQGYDDTTLRQISDRAGLGLATLFNYISNKRDLIYLIFNQEMDELVTKSLAAPRAWQTFTAKILSITEHHYRLHAQDPVLARILLSEVMLQAPGLHLSRYLENRLRLIAGMEGFIAQAQRAGEVTSTQPASLLARQVYYTFSSATRWWVAGPDPSWRVGQREFEGLLLSQMQGLAPEPAKRKPAAPVAATSPGVRPRKQPLPPLDPRPEVHDG